MEAGRFARVPVLLGANRDEGRTFAQGFARATEAEYVEWVRTTFGANADAVLGRYPLDAFSGRYAAAYAIGAIMTDSGLVAGIGGCETQDLAQTLAQRTRTWWYEFADRNAPGLGVGLPGYRWGAGHAMELPYLWPSFDNGIPLAAQFTPAQRRLSDEMVRRWGAFVRRAVPTAEGQRRWPQARDERLLSLRPGGRSAVVGADEYAAEHRCAFWRSLERRS